MLDDPRPLKGVSPERCCEQRPRPHTRIHTLTDIRHNSRLVTLMNFIIIIMFVIAKRPTIRLDVLHAMKRHRRRISSVAIMVAARQPACQSVIFSVRLAAASEHQQSDEHNRRRLIRLTKVAKAKPLIEALFSSHLPLHSKSVANQAQFSGSDACCIVVWCQCCWRHVVINQSLIVSAACVNSCYVVSI